MNLSTQTVSWVRSFALSAAERAKDSCITTHWQARPAFDRRARCADAIGCSRVSIYQVSSAWARSRKTFTFRHSSRSRPLKLRSILAQGQPSAASASTISMMSFGVNSCAPVANSRFFADCSGERISTDKSRVSPNPGYCSTTESRSYRSLMGRACALRPSFCGAPQ